MYINNLIYLLAANYHENPISNDESYQIISIISKYQQPIHNYKFDNVTNPQLYTTVEEVFYNLINAAQRDITVLSYKHPEFSNYENFPIINRLVQYIADLYLLENTSSLIGYRYIENYENIHKNIKSTIQNGLKEIKHSYEIMDKSINNFILPKLNKFNAEKNLTILNKNEIYNLAVFTDKLNNSLMLKENQQQNDAHNLICNYQVLNNETLENLKNSILCAYNLVKEENQQQHTKIVKEMEQVR